MGKDGSGRRRVLPCFNRGMSDPRKAYESLIKELQETSVLASVGSVLGWDERTQLPPRGTEHRRGNRRSWPNWSMSDSPRRASASCWPRWNHPICSPIAKATWPSTSARLDGNMIAPANCQPSWSRN